MDRRHRKVRMLTKQALLLCLNEVEEIIEEQINKNKVWVRAWLTRRPQLGCSTLILNELKNEDPQEFKALMRMTSENFDVLLALITPRIQKTNTMMRDAIPAKVKLEICMAYLVTGVSYRWLQHHFRVSKSAISKLIPEVCIAISEELKDFIKVNIYFVLY